MGNRELGTGESERGANEECVNGESNRGPTGPFTVLLSQPEADACPLNSDAGDEKLFEEGKQPCWPPS